MIKNHFGLPKDDILNWLFLEVGERQFGFIYKIKKPLEATYNRPFETYLFFLMNDTVKELIELNKVYEVLRGSENIGSLKITKILT